MGFDCVISGALAECVGLSSATQLIVLHHSGGSVAEVYRSQNEMFLLVEMLN